MNKLYASLLLVLTLFLFHCNSANNENDYNRSETPAPSQEALAEGFKLIETNCFSCHSPNASIENRIAPPMVAIKKHYIDESTSEEEFKAALIEFLNNPSVENSKMPQAIEKFNLMPKMSFSEEQLSNIATYIFHSELEKPEWFDKHYQEEKKKYSSVENDEKTPLEIGQSLALQTKAVLGKNLMQAINSEGTEHAISFCSTKAITITDSMSLALNASIKRVSDKNRNPNNFANESELEYINEMKNAIANGMEAKPGVFEKDGKHIGYYPIISNQMCLQCHGKPNSDISASTLLKIDSLYPNDKAIGYGTNELRGIWVIEMDKL